MDQLEVNQKREELQKRQQEINGLYKKEGLTDRVLDLQLELNSERHRLNISDERNRIYKNFVQ